MRDASSDRWLRHSLWTESRDLEIPDNITSDRCSTMFMEFWAALAKLMRTPVHKMTAYNPACNCLVKRNYRTLKASLMTRCAGNEWFYHLPGVMLSLRTCPKEGLDAFLGEMIYGEALVVPGKFFPPEEDHKVEHELCMASRKVANYVLLRPRRSITESFTFTRICILSVSLLREMTLSSASRPPLSWSVPSPPTQWQDFPTRSFREAWLGQHRKT